MANALACRRCGNTIASDRLKLEFDGNCPWCLAAFALVDPHQDDPAPASLVPCVQASDRLGKYLLTEQLGTGGMGEVWKALDTELNRWVALKFLKDQDSKELARFAREAHMAAKLSHPNIAAVHEIGEVGGRHYIAMQCIEGRTLETFRTNDRRLLVRLCLDAAKALDHAHRHGVIHRDVKPGNLMVEETEEGMKVVVLDFGLARSIEGGEKLSMSGSVVGTPQYLSPEQARAEKLDERTDVYSLGATMYEIFTGHALFEGENVYEILKKIENEAPIAPRKIKPQINLDLQTIILKCLEKDRERRYAGAKELAQDLRRFLNHEAVLARPPSAIYLLRMKLSKRKAVMAVAASSLAVVAGLLLFLVPKWREADRGAEAERARTGARSLAQPHIDLARILLQRMEQVLSVDEDRTAELNREGKRVKGELEKALAVSPDHEEALFELGRAHGFLGNRKRAVECYAKSVEASPRVTKAYLERALLNLDRYEELRHQLDGKANPDTETSSKLLALIRSDVRKVSEWSKDIPQLKHSEAMLLFAEGKWGEAADRWKECVDLSPGDAVAWLWRGHALIHAGRPGDAVAALDRALHFRPRHAYALHLRGLARSGLNDLEAAIADFDKAIKLDPQFAGAYSNRGAAKRGLGRLDEALADLDKAIELDSTFAGAYSNRGLAKSGKGLHDDAIADHTKAIELDPKHALFRFNRGMERAGQGHFNDAIADYDEVIKLDPEYRDAYCNRGLAKHSIGLYDDAIADCTKAIDLDPKHAKGFDNRRLANAYNNRGMAKAGKGLHDEAIADFDESIKLDPKDAKAWSNRGSAKRAKGLLDEAIADCTEALRLNPKFANAYSNRGNAKSYKGLHDEAIADHDEAIKLNPKDALARYNRGVAKRAKGLLDESITDYTEAIRLDPNFAAAYFNRGNVKSDKGLLDEAIEDFTKTIALDPKAADAYLCRGNARSDKGQYDEAIADYTEAIKRAPHLEDAYAYRGNAKCAQGLFDEAIADYTEAIRLDPKYDDAYANRALAKSKRGLLDEAIADYKMALEVAPPGWSYRPVIERSLAEIDAPDARDPKLKAAWQSYGRSARLLYEKKYAESIEGFRKIAGEFPKKQIGVDSAYSIACAYALLGEKKNALDWLEKAVDMGWNHPAHLERDPDLGSLRNESRYRKLTEKLRAR